MAVFHRTGTRPPPGELILQGLDIHSILPAWTKPGPPWEALHKPVCLLS